MGAGGAGGLGLKGLGCWDGSLNVPAGVAEPGWRSLSYGTGPTRRSSRYHARAAATAQRRRAYITARPSCTSGTGLDRSHISARASSYRAACPHAQPRLPTGDYGDVSHPAPLLASLGSIGRLRTERGDRAPLRVLHGPHAVDQGTRHQGTMAVVSCPRVHEA